MYTIKLLAPFIFSACAEGILTNGNGWICNIDQPKPNAIKYYEPGKSCYRDGVFYPRCEDLNNKEVQYYHNLLYQK